MNLKTFERIVQTFGASCSRWETNDLDAVSALAQSDNGKTLIRTEQLLDNKLDLLCVPTNTLLAERLYTTIVNEKTKNQILLFLRYSTWLSLLFMIGGFYLGWYQTHQDYLNTQSYFDTIFDINY